MNFLNRAYKNVTRRLTKSVLLAITFFLIGNLVILGLGISQAAENAKTLTRQKMRAVVSYEVDYEAYWNYINTLTDQDEIEKANNNYPKLDKEIALKIAQDEDVRTFNYMTSYVMYSQNFVNVPLGNEEFNQNNSYIDENGNTVTFKNPNIYVFTNTIPNMIEFEEGTNTIVEGRFYTQEEIDSSASVAVISQELAQVNNFRLGDEIVLSNNDLSNGGYYSDSGITQESVNKSYEIVGIYSTTNDIDPNSESFKYLPAYNSPKNYIYIPLTTMGNDMLDVNLKFYNYEKEKNPEYYTDGYVPKLEDFLTPHSVVILLNDPLNVDSFVERNQPLLAEYTRLNANNESFKTIAKPLDTLSFFANVIVWIVGINAIVIISLVTALTLKTREFEIGVLLSLGVSKFKVVMQLFMELVIVALLGFTLAVASGSLIAGQVGDKVLEFQQSQQDTVVDNNYNGGWVDPTNYFSNVSQDELFEEYKVSVNPMLIAQIYVFGLGVVFIAILIPSVMIMRLNPKQILLSTN